MDNVNYQGVDTNPFVMKNTQENSEVFQSRLQHSNNDKKIQDDAQMKEKPPSQSENLHSVNHVIKNKLEITENKINTQNLEVKNSKFKDGSKKNLDEKTKKTQNSLVKNEETKVKKNQNHQSQPEIKSYEPKTTIEENKI
jgi:hypothetical protein